MMSKTTQLFNKLKPLASPTSIIRCTVTFFFVLLTQLSLAQVPRFFSDYSLFLQLGLSALVMVAVMGFGRWCRRLAGIQASAPAFVFFSILFIWALFNFTVRKAVSPLMAVAFNLEVLLLVIGHCSIMRSDPGLVMDGQSCSKRDVEGTYQNVEAPAESSCTERIRRCSSCGSFIKGFDHHCPAFGNCVGQNNHVLFMVLLIGFLITEVSYIVYSVQFATKFHGLNESWLETSLSANMVVSTMLFSVLQVIWQGIFLVWHVYCICFNIRTDEWIKWKKYPEFQLHDQPQAGNLLCNRTRKSSCNQIGNTWYMCCCDVSGMAPEVRACLVALLSGMAPTVYVSLNRKYVTTKSKICPSTMTGSSADQSQDLSVEDDMF